MNGALTSCAHTQTHTVSTVTNSVLTPFVLPQLYLIHVWLPGEGDPRVIEIFRDVSAGKSMTPVDNFPLDRDLRTGVCYSGALDSGENTTIVLSIDFPP